MLKLFSAKHLPCHSHPDPQCISRQIGERHVLDLDDSDRGGVGPSFGGAGDGLGFGGGDRVRAGEVAVDLVALAADLRGRGADGVGAVAVRDADHLGNPGGRSGTRKAPPPTAISVPPTLPLRQRERTREGTSSANLWTGTQVPRNTGFPLMILPINRSLIGARVERISSARAPEMCPF